MRDLLNESFPHTKPIFSHRDPIDLPGSEQATQCVVLQPSAKSDLVFWSKTATGKRIMLTHRDFLLSRHTANAAMDHACPECMVTVLYVHQDHDLEVEHLENRYPENGHQEKEGMRSIGGPQPLKILAHAWPLSPTKPGPERSELEVLVVDSRRFRPEAKHSSWLRERRHLDAAKINVRSEKEPGLVNHLRCYL